MADKALLTGINRYQHISHLRGCINDVRMIERLLTELFGFSAENVRTLTDSQVTKERLLKEWGKLVQEVRAGDRLVFHFSGHGSFVADQDGDEDDGADELLCLYDMDFDDGQTYLMDDDLRKMTEQVPDGVFLTVLLDNCHAGTATRVLLAPSTERGLAPTGPPPLVDQQVTLARMRKTSGTRSLAARDAEELVTSVLTPATPLEARDTVLARFVEPPPHVWAALRRGGVRSSVRTAMEQTRGEEQMNHVLLAASSPTQTSADAYIDGDFHGAFSFYFDRSVREVGRDVEHQALIRRVRDVLAAEQFTQVPQLEPSGTGGPLFLRSGAGAPPATNSGARPAPAGGETATIADAVQLLQDIRAILLGERGGAAAGLLRATGRRALVFVHGICRHEADFADPWWEALRPHLSAGVRQALEGNRHPVVWSDLVTPERGISDTRDPRQAAREQELASLLRDVLEDRAVRESLAAVEAQPADRAPVATRGVQERALFGIPGLNCIDDFAKYLLNDSIRRAVQQRFLDKVLPLLREGAEIEVISHSWGTVVAYEALRTIDSQQFPGRVHNLFTVGAALSIVPVQRRLEPGIGRRPQHVVRWINLDARGDIVGGPLASAFPVTLEFLNLVPTACRARLGFVEPSCAHSSYFNAQNGAVNRDIFAAQIEDRG